MADPVVRVARTTMRQAQLVTCPDLPSQVLLGATTVLRKYIQLVEELYLALITASKGNPADIELESNNHKSAVLPLSLPCIRARNLSLRDHPMADPLCCIGGTESSQRTWTRQKKRHFVGHEEDGHRVERSVWVLYWSILTKLIFAAMERDAKERIGRLNR